MFQAAPFLPSQLARLIKASLPMIQEAGREQLGLAPPLSPPLPQVVVPDLLRCRPLFHTWTEEEADPVV